MSRDRYSRSNIIIVIDKIKPVCEIDILRGRQDLKYINIIEVASESDIDDIVITY